MLPTGDDLTIILFWSGLAVTALIAAVQSTGRTRWGLAALGLAMASLAAAIGLAPVRIPWLSSIPLVNAAIAPATITMAAIMVRSMTKPLVTKLQSSPSHEIPAGTIQARRPPARLNAGVRNEHEARTKSLFKPDITVEEAAVYLLSNRSTWSDPYGRKVRELVVKSIHSALTSGQITGWAKLHPDAEEFQVAKDKWFRATLDRVDGYAMLKGTAIHGLRLSRAEVEAAWPPR
ncbi:hypothetical protein [Brevundimonas diminuta]|uniref:hypothetical protein n=1 Tax=Brevundimonas diminuta TaxID=293 RepID=UPI003D9A8981